MAVHLLRSALLATLALLAMPATSQQRTALPQAHRDLARLDVPPAAEARVIDAGVPRVALVVGNGAYRHAPRLDNPVRDVRALCQRFTQLGFAVECLEDAGTRQDMRDAIARLQQRTRPGSVTLFYFAGHGLQDRGENYLLPVDARIQHLDDVDRQGLPLGDLMQAVSGLKPLLNLVFIDACRENMVDQVDGQVLPRGFAAVDAPANTMVFYSTAPGRLALDRGNGAAARNSPFAHALLTHLADPGVPVEETFKSVIGGVRSNTAGRQVPWVNSSFAGAFCFGTCKAPVSEDDLRRMQADKQHADAERERVSAEKQVVERKLKALETERSKPAAPPPPPAF